MPSVGYQYKAFISYSQAADGELAPKLQYALHRFGKPWYRLRAMRVFRDATTLAVTPHLWPAIEAALAASEYLILLASPRAAASAWVQKEVDYWRTHKSVDTILVLLTDGELVWDNAGNDFPWSAITPLPPALRGTFTSEPLYIDVRWAREGADLSSRNPRFQDAVAALAATLHGRPKDELVGDDIRQHRKTARIAWSAGGVLSTLLVAACLAGFLFFRANEQAKSSRKVAQESVGNIAGVSAAAFDSLDKHGLINESNFKPFRQSLLDEAARRIERVAGPLADSPDVSRAVSEAYIELAYRIHEVGAMEEAAAAYRLAIPPLERLADKNAEVADRLRLALVHNNIGWVLSTMGQRDEALKENQTALDMREALYREHPDDPEVIRAVTVSYANLGLNALTPRDALTWMLKALPLQQVLAKRTADEKYRWYLLNLSSTWNNLGNKYEQLGDLDEVLKCRQESLAIRQRLVDTFQGDKDNFPLHEYLHPLAKAQAALAKSYFDRGDYPLAIKHYKLGRDLFKEADRQYEIDTKSPTPNHQYLFAASIGLRQMGEAYSITGDFGAASECFAQAVTALETAVRVNPGTLEYATDLSAAYVDLARSVAAKGKREESLAWVQKAYDRAGDTAAQFPDEAEAKKTLAYCCMSLADVQPEKEPPHDSVQLSEKAVRLYADVHRADPDNIDVRSLYAGALDGLGNQWRRRRQPDKGVDAHVRAAAEMSEVVRLAPAVLQHRQHLYGIYLRLALGCKDAGAAMEDAEVRRKARELWTGRVEELVRTAKEILTLSAAKPNGATDRREEPPADDMALTILEDAVALGYTDLEEIRREPQFQHLVGNQRFTRLVQMAGK